MSDYIVDTSTVINKGVNMSVNRGTNNSPLFISLFMFSFIILLSILSIFYLFRAIIGAEIAISLDINSYDEDTLLLAITYFQWAIFLMFITIFVSLIPIILIGIYKDDFIFIFNGWELWGITFFLILITTGGYFLSSWGAEYLNSIINEDLIENAYTNSILSSSIIVLINAILVIANVIFLWQYLSYTQK